MNFKKAKIRCSDLYSVMSLTSKNRKLTDKQSVELDKLLSKEELTEKQDIRLKELSERRNNELKLEILSKGCITTLVDVYSRYKYDKNEPTFQGEYVPSLMNGTLSEGASLKILSELDGVDYKLEKSVISNSYLSGIIDAYIGDKPKGAKVIIDVKTATSLQSLLVNLRKDVKPQYYWQMMGYLFITGADYGEVCHVLPSYHPTIIESELQKLKHRLSILELDEKELDIKCNRLIDSLTFDDIDIRKRVVRFRIEPDKKVFKQIKEKIKHCREWLSLLDKEHTALNDKKETEYREEDNT